MNIAIDDARLKTIVEKELASGEFSTAEEVVASALMLLDSMNAVRVPDHNELRAMMQVGIDEADRGLTLPWIPGEIRKRVEQRFAALESADANRTADTDRP